MAESLVVGGQLGNYLLESVIGRGGMSVVYRGQHMRLSTMVALKVLAQELGTDDKFRERFLREAKMAAGIDHPNVIPIYDTGIYEESLYIVMRYVSGGDLRGLLRESPALDPERTLAILGPVARALDAAHAHGLVHRDVKPANILLQRSSSGEVEHVYLSDFGVTKHTTSASGLTGTGALVGTIDYMAPEQIEGQSVTPRTDVYALGCLFYQCITGRVPFERESEAAVLWAHMRDPVEPPSRVRGSAPPELDSAIGRALTKNPEERFATCEEFILACRAATPPQHQQPGNLAPPHYSPTVTASSPEATAQEGGALAGAGQLAPGPFTRAEAGREGGFGGGGAGAGMGSGGNTPPASSPPGGTGDPPRGGGPGHRPGGRGWLAKRGWALALLVAVVGGGIAAIVVLTSSSSSSPSSSGGQKAAKSGIPATLKPVPTNHVTGSGNATIELKGTTATVSLDTNGLVTGSHAMHIHAGGKGICPPRSAANRHNGHLAISTVDGAPFYGAPESALTTRGDTSPASILAFARFPNTGKIKYNRKLKITRKLASQIRSNDAVVIVHGIDYNGNGTYDNVIDRSDLNRKYPGEITAPALCGPLKATKANANASTGHHAGGGRIYTATLTVRPGIPAGWLCSVPGAAGTGTEARQAGKRTTIVGV